MPVLVGDGPFQMTSCELGNARDCGCDPIMRVFNKASREMRRTVEPAARFNDRPRWDFASMAAGMGGDGHAVGAVAELRVPLARCVKAVKRLSVPG